jgi:hypothetical protein
MNAWLRLNTPSQPMLLIPSKALIDTGTEQRVITVDNDGRFVPKRIEVPAIRRRHGGQRRSQRRRKGGLQRPVPDRLGSQYFRRWTGCARRRLPPTPTEEMTHD